jgi:predicted DNA-binding ribbon-helix-helix protein
VALKADKVLKVAKKKKCYSVENHFFQTLAKMASGLKQVLAKLK